MHHVRKFSTENNSMLIMFVLKTFHHSCVGRNIFTVE